MADSWRGSLQTWARSEEVAAVRRAARANSSSPRGVIARSACATKQSRRWRALRPEIASLPLERNKMVQGHDTINALPRRKAGAHLPALSRRADGSRLAPGKRSGGGFMHCGSATPVGTNKNQVG